MAFLFADSFDHYTTLLNKWSSVGAGGSGGSIGAYGRNSTNGLRQTSINNQATINLPSSVATIVVGFAFNLEIVGTKYLIGLWDNGTVHLTVRFESNGTLTVRRNTTLLGTTTAVFPGSAYHYVELKATIHDSTGTAVLKVNDVEVLNLSNVDTRNGANAVVNQLTLGYDQAGNGSTDCRYDDVVVMSTAGDAPTDFIGDVRVECLLPSGAGDSAQWTASAGSNYQCVDETAPNEDTDYVSSSTTGHKDLYAMGNLSSTGGSVHAVCVTMRARKDDAGSRTVKAKVKHSSTEDDGADRSMPTGFAYTQDFFPDNPSTTDPWTPTEVNAMQAGGEVVA